MEETEEGEEKEEERGRKESERMLPLQSPASFSASSFSCNCRVEKNRKFCVSVWIISLVDAETWRRLSTCGCHRSEVNPTDDLVSWGSRSQCVFASGQSAVSWGGQSVSRVELWRSVNPEARQRLVTPCVTPQIVRPSASTSPSPNNLIFHTAPDPSAGKRSGEAERCQCRADN